MIRRSFPALFALALPLVLLLASGAGAAAGDPSGTARTALDVASLQLGNLPAVALGTVDSYASTDLDPAQNSAARPFARVRAALPGGGEVTASSEGTGEVPGVSLALPTGTLTLGRLQASAGPSQAQSRLDALQGDVRAAGTGLRATLPATGLFSAVDARAATASNGVLLSDLGLDLTDVLPAELLAQLPLSTLLDLADVVPLDLEADLGGLLDQVRAVADAVDAVAVAHAEIDALQAQLDALSDELAGAQAAVADAAATAAAADEILADAQAAVGAAGDAADDAVDAAGGVLRAQAGTVQDAAAAAAAAAADLAAAQGLVDQLQQAIDAAQGQLDAVIGSLDGLLDALEAALGALPDVDLQALLRGLLEGLTGSELLGVEQLLVGVVSAASPGGSSAAATCQVRGVRVLGQPVGADTCAELAQAVAGLDSTLSALLAGLPLVSDLTADTVTVTPPATRVSEDGARDGAYHVGEAAITPLSVAVASVTLTAVADGLIVEVSDLVDGALAELGTLAGVDVSAAATALGDLQGALAGLPLEAALDGVQTPAVALTAAGASAGSRFRAAAVGGPAAVNPATTAAVTPRSPTAQALPRTGGGVGMALALTAVGGSGVAWLRRRRVA